MPHIITVPAFSDNYIWLICDENKRNAIIVDPGDASPVIKVLEKENIQAAALLITHFHYDHANGISELLKRYPNIPVYGPEAEYHLLKENPNPPTYGPASHGFKYLTHPLNDGDTVTFDNIGASFKVLSLAGHTSGHIGYYDSNNKKLFCGDTLFAGGCGRVFNGTLEKLHNSLQKIAQLPKDTLLYCAHEYTLDNIGFAKWVEPENPDVLAREEADRALIDSDQATVPSLLSLELKTNPFLRTSVEHVIKRVEEKTGKELKSASEVFCAMRIWKDTVYD